MNASNSNRHDGAFRRLKVRPAKDDDAVTDASPPPTIVVSPGNPKEFTKLISGISGMQDDLKKKEDTIKQLTEELDNVTREKKASSKSESSEDSTSVPSKVILGGSWSPAKNPTKKGTSPRRRNKKTQDQQAAMEAFMEKVRRRESTTKDWERLVKTMQDAKLEEKKNRNNFEEKLSLVFDAREKGSSGNDVKAISKADKALSGRPKDGAKVKKGEEEPRPATCSGWLQSLTNCFHGGGGDSTTAKNEKESDPPIMEMKMGHTLIKVFVFVAVVLASIQVLGVPGDSERPLPAGSVNGDLEGVPLSNCFLEKISDPTAFTDEKSLDKIDLTNGRDLTEDGEDTRLSQKAEINSVLGASPSAAMNVDGMESYTDAVEDTANSATMGEGRRPLKNKANEGPRWSWQPWSSRAESSNGDTAEDTDDEFNEGDKTIKNSNKEEEYRKRPETVSRSEWRQKLAVVVIVLLGGAMARTGDGLHGVEDNVKNKHMGSPSKDERAGRRESGKEVETSPDTEFEESIDGKLAKKGVISNSLEDEMSQLMILPQDRSTVNEDSLEEEMSSDGKLEEEVGGSNDTGDEIAKRPKTIQLMSNSAVHIGDVYLNSKGDEAKLSEPMETNNSDYRIQSSYSEGPTNEGMEEETGYSANLGNEKIMKPSFDPRNVISQHYSRPQ